MSLAAAEALQAPAPVAEEQAQPSMASRMMSHPMARKIVTGIAIASGIGGAGAVAEGVAEASAPVNSTTVTIEGPSISVDASSVATKEMSLLEDVHIGGKVVKKTCYWDKSFMNSGRGADGKLYLFKDENGKLCRDKNSPTGWVKVGGGLTGRNCGNPAKPNGPAPGKVVENVTIVPKLSMKVKLHALAIAGISNYKCGDALVTAYGQGEAWQTLRLKTFAKSHNKAKLLLNLEDKATAAAHANVNCETTPPTVPPKDGTQGAGEGTPGQTTPDGTGIGGPGAGGQPGNPTEGAQCRDQVTGEPRTGTSDQFGYCN